MAGEQISTVPGIEVLHPLALAVSTKAAHRGQNKAFRAAPWLFNYHQGRVDHPNQGSRAVPDISQLRLNELFLVTNMPLSILSLLVRFQIRKRSVHGKNRNVHQLTELRISQNI